MEDGRLLFAIPFETVTLLGTTDTDHDGSPDDLAATPQDVAYILAAAQRTFPLASLAEPDLVSTFAGLRPLVLQPERGVGETSREEAILPSKAGLITVTGGKLTTARAMGKKAVDRASALLARQGVSVGASATRDRPFPGKPSVPMPEFLMRARETAASSNPDLHVETVSHLAWRYGRRASEVMRLALEDRQLCRPLCPGLPDIDAEVVFAARAEDARSLSDILIRRTHLFWQAPRQGLEAVERTADLLERELGWTADQRRASLEQYAREVARSREWSGGGAEITTSYILYSSVPLAGELRQRRVQHDGSLALEAGKERKQNGSDTVLPVGRDGVDVR